MSRLLAFTDPKGKTTRYAYDPMNRITEMTDALSGKTKFTYDANGNLLTVTDAKNQTITYTYDMWDNVASMTDQLGKTEHYVYDLKQNLAVFTDRKGQQTAFNYDLLDRLADIRYADGSSLSYVYDAGGRLTTLEDSISGMISRSYDTLDRLSSETTSFGSISYAYDAIGRRTGMRVAGQPEVDYTYDANSRLKSVVGAGLVPARLSYDALGRRSSLTLPNGVMTTYAYDDGSNLLNINSLNPLNQILEKINYSYDKNGNRTSMDSLNMPVKLPNPVMSTSYNSANQMLSFNDASTGSARTMTYDANGNMTAVTNSCGTTTYTWDVRNRLVGINGFDTLCALLSASFKYDAMGRRIEKSITDTVNGPRTTAFLYDGLDIVQEIENGTVSANYMRTLNIDEPLLRIADNALRFYQQDGLGSVIALTDEAGAIRTQYNYDPFGNTEMIGETSDNPFQYTGRENDGTGLYYYRARYYSPELQRFISEDPIGLMGGINKFAYVRNNPVNWIDPLGLCRDNVDNAVDTLSEINSIVNIGIEYSSLFKLSTPTNAALASAALILDKVQVISGVIPGSASKDMLDIGLNSASVAVSYAAGSSVGVASGAFFLGYGVGKVLDSNLNLSSNLADVMYETSEWMNGR